MDDTMTKEEAIKLVNEALAQVQASRIVHIKLVEALNIITKCECNQKKEEVNNE
jgi:hypothetical protein